MKMLVIENLSIAVTQPNLARMNDLMMKLKTITKIMITRSQ